MGDRLYDLSKLKETLENEDQVPSFVQDFIQVTLDEDLTNLHRAYIQEKRYQCKKMANQLKFSLYMFGIHKIQKDLELVEELAASSSNFDKIGPIMKRIKAHLRKVKNQLIDDYKMVITIVD